MTMEPAEKQKENNMLVLPQCLIRTYCLTIAKWKAFGIFAYAHSLQTTNS